MGDVSHLYASLTVLSHCVSGGAVRPAPSCRHPTRRHHSLNAEPNANCLSPLFLALLCLALPGSNMVFPVGAGNPYRNKSGPQSIENATAEIAAAAAHTKDMRFWFVPSPAIPIQVGQLTNLSGGCNASAMCQGGPTDPANWGCSSDCHIGDSGLVHSWTAVTPDTVRPLSAVCYVAIERIKQRTKRPVGIVASYVGGTPVGTWAADSHADTTCQVTAKNIPCDASKNYCPGPWRLVGAFCRLSTPRVLKLPRDTETRTRWCHGCCRPIPKHGPDPPSPNASPRAVVPATPVRALLWDGPLVRSVQASCSTP